MHNRKNMHMNIYIYISFISTPYQKKLLFLSVYGEGASDGVVAEGEGSLVGKHALFYSS